MAVSISKKVQKPATNLNLSIVLRLIWSVSPGWTALSCLLILIESAFFFGSLYLLKVLVDTVSQAATRPGQNERLVTGYLLAVAAAGVLSMAIKGISGCIAEMQAARVTEHIDSRIHACAVDLDLSFYESPDYFDVLKRAKDALPDRPNAIATMFLDLGKNIMNIIATGVVLFSIDPMLLPLLALFALPIMAVRIKFADRLNKWRLEETPLERRSAFLGSLITGETAAKDIKGYGLGHHLNAAYGHLRLRLLSERLQISRRRTANETVTTSLVTLCFFSCIGYIILGTLRGVTSIGDIALFLMTAPQAFSTMQGFAFGISSLYHNNIMWQAYSSFSTSAHN